MTREANFFNRVVSIVRRDRNGVGKDAFATMPDFVQLIRQRKWRKVKKTLRSPTAANVCSIVDATGLSALGAAIGYNAPYEVIKAIYDLNPSAATQPDDFGSLPLHIGCLNGSHPVVIELMLSQEHRRSEIASHLDMNKSSPLFYAVDFICSVISNDIKPSMTSSPSRAQGSDERSKSFPSAWLHINDDIYHDMVVGNAISIITMLCEYAPECALISNRDGDTPIDVIQEKKLLVVEDENYQIVEDIYQVLQDAAICDYRKKKSAWEAQGYDKRIPTSAFSLISSEDEKSEDEKSEEEKSEEMRADDRF